VVPHEREERSELHPSIAELFVGVGVEATNCDEKIRRGQLEGRRGEGRGRKLTISSDERDTEELELESMGDRVLHVLPGGVVVACKKGERN